MRTSTIEKERTYVTRYQRLGQKVSHCIIFHAEKVNANYNKLVQKYFLLLSIMSIRFITTLISLFCKLKFDISVDNKTKKICLWEWMFTKLRVVVLDDKGNVHG